MNRLFVANWKTNPLTEKAAVALAKAEDFPNAVICPPAPFLSAVKKVLKKAALGAQNVFTDLLPAGGAFTGEISSAQLKALGASYVIVGHSERRIHLLENNEMISRKVEAVLKAGMTPILCVGENENEKAMGRTEEIVSRQLELGLSKIDRSKTPPQIVIAYEPIWAISKGDPTHVTDSPEDADKVISMIRARASTLSVRPFVIYGGSVNAGDWAGFAEYAGIQGALVGGASLKAAEFKKIIK